MFNKRKNSDFNYFLALTIINVVLMLFAGIFYTSGFHFWDYPVSYLGTTKTQTGALNLFSSHIYSLDMFLTGAILYALAFHTYKKKSRNILHTLLCFLAGSGAFIAGASPDDTAYIFHVLGSALLVSSLWLLSTAYLYEVRKILGKTKYYFFQGILQIPIVAYAGAYFLSLDPTSSILQKFALTGLIINLLYATRVKNYIPSTLRAS